jgi:hypothetical protein
MKYTLFVNFFGGPCAGKCFLENTKIVMHDGSLKNIQDIKLGEYVMGIDSKPKKVKGTHNGYDMMYTIQHHDSTPYIVNSRHLVTLKRTAGSYYKNKKGINSKRYPKLDDVIHVPVLELLTKKEKFFRSFKGFKVPIELAQKEVEIDPYFVGLWLGDGCKNIVSVCSADLEIKEYLYTISKKFNLNINEIIKKDNKAIDYRFSAGRNHQTNGGNTLLKIFQELNLIKNKHIPDVFLYNDIENRLKLLAGLLDSDGNLSNNCFSITQKDEELAKQIKRLADSLGFKTSLKKIKKKIKSISFEGYYYVINISGNIDTIPTKIKRKKSEQLSSKRDRNCYGIKSITEYGYDEYYGIEVEDGLLLLEDNLVAHNSTISAQLFAKLKWAKIDSELVSEYAKQLVWEESFPKMRNQIYIFGKQHKRQEILNGKVDVVITDSPLPLGFYYDGGNTKYLKEIIMSEFSKLYNLNILIDRPEDYNPNGRMQTKEQADQAHTEIESLLNDNGIPYITIPSSDRSADLLFDRVVTALESIRKNYPIHT